MFKLLVRTLFWLGIALGIYVLTILWRVSLAEKHWFGRSELIPMTWPRPQFKKPPVLGLSYTSRTYLYTREDGQQEIVWKEKINAFQHVYGSALTAYETTPVFADKLFCLNEFSEAIFDANGISKRDYMDRRKDLAHNRVGWEIAQRARQKNLNGEEADMWMQREVLRRMKTWQDMFPHHWDPRIEQLPDEAAQGCPGLPDQSIRDWLDKMQGERQP